MVTKLLSPQLIVALAFCYGSTAALAQANPEPFTPPTSALRALSDFNVTVFDSLEANNSIQGKSLVGEDVFGSSSSFGSALTLVGTEGLVIGGDLLGGSKTLENGSNLHLVGNDTALINFNGGGQLIRETSVDLGSLYLQAANLANQLASLPDAGTVVIPAAGGQPGAAHIHATPNSFGLAVINVPNGEGLFGNSLVQQIEVSTNGAQAVVINVGGQHINFNQGNFVGITTTDATSSRLLWNFYEAESLDLQRAFEGSVLAPNASIINASDIDGSVVARALTAQASVGLPLFVGAEAVESALTLDDLGYPTELTLVAGDPVSLVPESSGVLSGYVAVPALPVGLQLNADTGVITGVAGSQPVEGEFTISAGGVEQTVYLSVQNSVAPMDLNPTSGLLIVEGLNPFVPNPTVASVTYALEGAKYDSIPNDIRIAVNGNTVDPSLFTLTEDQIQGTLQLSPGRNEVDFKFYDEFGRPVYDNRVVYAASGSLEINLVSESGQPLSGDEVTVTVRLADSPNVVSQLQTLDGSITINNLPPRTVLIEARTPSNLVGSTGAFVPDGDVTLVLRSFNTPSGVDNNDISLGLEGWEFSAGAASIVPHEEGTFSASNGTELHSVAVPIALYDDSNGMTVSSATKDSYPTKPSKKATGSQARAKEYENFLETKQQSETVSTFSMSATSVDSDIRLTTVGEGPQQLSRTFVAPAGAGTVRIRYRFITSEVPGGYFGTQYNDTFSVSLRSQSQGGIRSESGSMNGLGLISFDSSGKTAWREVELLIGDQGDVIQADITVANVADGAYDSMVEVDFIAVEADPVTPSITWDSNDGGLDISYTIGGDQPTEESVDIELYWASGSARGNTIGQSFYTYTVASGTSPGGYGPVDAIGNFLTAAPESTTHVLAVAGKNIDAVSDVGVGFGANANQATVSAAMIDIVKDATRQAGTPATVITSTARTPQDQARAMFQNLSRGNDIAANVADQLLLYAAPGDQVVRAFESAAAGFTPAEIRGAEQAQIRQAMLNEINNQGCERVSRHCADPNQFTVIDVGRSPYSPSGQGRFVNEAQPRVDRLLNEDRNNAFHLELSNAQNP